MRRVLVVSIVAICSVLTAVGMLGKVLAAGAPPSVDYTKIVPADLVKNTPKGKLSNPYKDTQADIVAQGQSLFRSYSCSGCHGGNGVGGNQSGSTVRAPGLAGLYGSPVTLTDGRIVTADDRYIRDCILAPDTQRVASYPPVMPSFAGQISEEDLLKIIAYIKSLVPESPS